MPVFMDFPDGLEGKEFACNVGGLGLISGLGRSPGGGNGNPLQYSCLGNPMDRGAWWATVHQVAEVDTTEHVQCQLCNGIMSKKNTFVVVAQSLSRV